MAVSQQYPFQVRQLPYSYITFTPSVCANTMYLHHNQYYAQQVKLLNQLVLQHRLTDRSLESLICEDIKLPVPQLKLLKGTAGSVYNHELYFDSVKKASSSPPLNRLVGVLLAVYGSMQRFYKLMAEAAESLPGAGWVWLVAERNCGPHIVITQNNDVVSLKSVQPIFVIDAWEHSFFLDFQFDTEKYITTWLSFIDWDKAEERFLSSQPSDFSP